jgi:alkylation response protein AidB-like acyl-CoA dehydrogenase
MEGYFRDAKQSMVGGGGTSQIQRTLIARSMEL